MPLAGPSLNGFHRRLLEPALNGLPRNHQRRAWFPPNMLGLYHGPCLPPYHQMSPSVAVSWLLRNSSSWLV